MPKVSLAHAETAPLVAAPRGSQGPIAARALFARSSDPLHLHLYALDAGAGLPIAAPDHARIAYVWSGAVRAGKTRLEAGSSLMVERGGELRIEAEGRAKLLVFASAPGGPGTAADEGAEGRIHLLPCENVPRSDDVSGGGVGGGIHANAGLAGCGIWLHENHFPASPDAPPFPAEAGIHCHSEDEIIVVVSGSIQLGQRLEPAGTAIAIARDTYYTFQPGPQGLSFINFRAGKPDRIRMRSGREIDEVGFWRDRLPAPAYLAPA